MGGRISIKVVLPAILQETKTQFQYLIKKQVSIKMKNKLIESINYLKKEL